MKFFVYTGIGIAIIPLQWMLREWLFVNYYIEAKRLPFFVFFGGAVISWLLSISGTFKLMDLFKISKEDLEDEKSPKKGWMLLTIITSGTLVLLSIPLWIHLVNQSIPLLAIYGMGAVSFLDTIQGLCGMFFTVEALNKWVERYTSNKIPLE